MARGTPCWSRVCLSRGRMLVSCVSCTAAQVVHAALPLGLVQHSVTVFGNTHRIVCVFTRPCVGCYVPGDVACCLLDESLR